METGMAATDLGDGGAVMDRPLVPDQDDMAAEMAQQIPQEDGDLDMGEIVGMHVEREAQVLPARADGEGGDRRHLIAPIPVVNQRGLAARGPRAPYGRNQLEARFIGKYEVCVQSADFF
jgi:hypothetical protein